MEAALGVHIEHHIEEICRMEVMVGPSGKRRWSDEYKGQVVADWRIDYNTERPHSSLKYQTPEEFAAVRPFNKAQWAQPLELIEGSAPAPIAHAAE